jgi:hypothetical protein
MKYSFFLVELIFMEDTKKEIKKKNDFYVQVYLDVILYLDYSYLLCNT